MGKKKFLDRISDALGLYDPDDPNRVLEEDEEESDEEEAAEKPVRKGFPKAIRPAPVPVAKEEPVPAPVEKEVKEKKG